MEILKGIDVRKALLSRIGEEVSALSAPPVLSIVRAGEDPSDLSYEKNARKMAEKLGIEVKLYAFPADVSETEFLEAFEKISADPETDGVLVFRPLPGKISEREVIKRLDPEKDVDFITDGALSDVFTGRTVSGPCTAEAVMEMLHYAGISVSGKHAVVIGRSMVVGKPLAMMLLKENATVTVCHSKTADLKAVTRSADLLFVCIGKAGFIDGSYVKEGAAVFDIGINALPDGGITGDCEPVSVSEKAALLTPVPGGVGSVTTAVLMHHVVENAKKRRMK